MNMSVCAFLFVLYVSDFPHDCPGLNLPFTQVPLKIATNHIMWTIKDKGMVGLIISFKYAQLIHRCLDPIHIKSSV